MEVVSKKIALNISNLSVCYHNAFVLSDINLTVDQGILVGVIGPNGAGKTTFLKALLGLIPIASGLISILDVPVKDARKKIAYVPQRSTVDWDFPLTVFDMVLMGCYGRLGWFASPTTDDHEKTYQALALVGLDREADKSIGALSGGQQQRAFLARALLQDAQLFFLDEPFAGVDVPTEKIIMNVFKKLRDEGKTIIVVHHDLLTAPVYFDSVVLLNKTIIDYGPVENVFTPENITRVYGSVAVNYPFDLFKNRNDII